MNFTMPLPSRQSACWGGEEVGLGLEFWLTIGGLDRSWLGLEFWLCCVPIWVTWIGVLAELCAYRQCYAYT